MDCEPGLEEGADLRNRLPTRMLGAPAVEPQPTTAMKMSSA